MTTKARRLSDHACERGDVCRAASRDLSERSTQDALGKAQDDSAATGQKRRLKGTPFIHQLRPETVMGFAALYPSCTPLSVRCQSYGPTIDPRYIENGMKPALSGWHDIRIYIFAAYLSLEIKWAKS
jgi:hypothetical protein